MDAPTYEIYAARYAESVDRTAASNFIFPDDHDAPMPLDYFVFALRGAGRTVVVDTGFNAEVAARRGRKLSCHPAEALSQIGIEAATAQDVVLTHMHYDHAGCMASFPAATFHMQEREMAFATGRCMCHRVLRAPLEVDDVMHAVRCVFSDRMRFHDGTSTLLPGVTLHLVGGHSGGLQIIRVPTARGWVVLAGDASHYWANIRGRNPFPIVVDVAAMLEGFRVCESLADGPDHIIPGHDPLILKRFPPVPGTRDVVRVDLAPVA